MRIGSLFAGIGGLELGLEWAGVGCTSWQVEQDAFCRRVLAQRFPDSERFEDVRSVTSDDLVEIDLLCGGFPCQDISAAGKREGLGGARSGLWAQFDRLVGELQPNWVVVENVAHGRPWVDAVRSALAERGYESAPVPLRARDVGAPHRRARIFVVARRRKLGRSDVSEPVRDRPRAWPASRGAKSQHPWEPVRAAPAPSLPPHRGPRLHALGNSVVPHCAEAIGWLIRFASGGMPVGMQPTLEQAVALAYVEAVGPDVWGLGAWKDAETQRLMKAFKDRLNDWPISGWATPCSRDGKVSWSRGRGVDLPRQVSEWMTPLASDARRGAFRCEEEPGKFRTLVSDVSWPTPVTTDSKGARRDTARKEDWKSNRGETLTDAVRSEAGSQLRCACGAESNVGLSEPCPACGKIRDGYVNPEFPTPTASRYGTGGNGDPGDGRGKYAHAGSPSLDQIAVREGGTLNPSWVEALMGFPLGWTILETGQLDLFGGAHAKVSDRVLGDPEGQTKTT
jgi:DNA (cytosine-5)-methyltransferase 1